MAVSRRNHQLQRWLMEEVHGQDIGRKPPRRASSLTRGPARDARYLAWIRTLPCLSCGLEGASQAAHTGTDGGMRIKASDYSCVPLCNDCHTAGPGAYHRVGKTAFFYTRKVRIEKVVQQLTFEWFRRGEVK